MQTVQERCDMSTVTSNTQQLWSTNGQLTAWQNTCAVTKVHLHWTQKASARQWVASIGITLAIGWSDG